MNEKVRDAVPWLVVAVFLTGIAYQRPWFGWGAPDSSGPAKAVALAGGGMSDGDKCGIKGFHHFVLPAVSAASTGQQDPSSAGPQLVLGSYGFERASADDPGHFNVGLLLGPGRQGSMELSPPLGAQGVAVEIEGPAGLVGGAYGLPVKFDDAAAASPDGKIHIGRGGGGSAEVTIPVQALCPGYNGFDVQQKLGAPIDSKHTIIGQPPYTLTVSISDPAIGDVRTSVKSPVTGDVLSAGNNVMPL